VVALTWFYFVWFVRSFYIDLGAGAGRLYPKGWLQRYPTAEWVHIYQNRGDNTVRSE